MGFEAGQEGVSIKLYTGLYDCNVLAVNPTIAEAEKLGITIKDDTTYVSTAEEGHIKIRLDFWVKVNPLNVVKKLTFFLEDLVKPSQAGNTQFINDFGVSTYGISLDAIKANEKMKWYNTETAITALVGQADLTEFIKNWLSIDRDTVAKIDNVAKLYKGDVSDLKALITKYSDRQVQLLLHIKETDGVFYQNIYNRYFGRAKSTNTKFWLKELTDSTINYQNSFAQQEFNPLAVKPASNTSDAPVDDLPWK
jgi:hypothetical protein